ncbi:MAG: efflux RND transporter permease subunit [Candidatus Edwardsbacteria bacterium]|jgi:HAE1 family hydrophobic/amphiphilic exporter-1|nr:efflux RND transporter permease subunit [Candidatus Edwardsbacteria bacterium]
MILSEFGIKRPVTVLMIFIGLTIIGVVALVNLNIDLFPDMSFPIVAVMTDYPGVGPAEVESMVSRPMEGVVSMVRNVKNVRSTSREGASLIIVEFDWGTDIDAAAIDVREKIDLVKTLLPDGVRNPVIVKFDPALMPIMVAGVSSPRSVTELRQFASDNLKDRLARIPGVASVYVQGGRDRQIKVDVDRTRMEALGLSFDQVSMALAASNLNLPGGHLKTGNLDYLIRIPGEFKSVEQIAGTVIGNRGGTPIHLNDIARIEDSFAEFDSETLLNGQRSIVLVVQKQSGSNTVAVSDRIQAKLKELQREMPSDIRLQVAFDSADFIRGSISSLQREALFGALLSVLIILLFLRNFSSTLIISVSIPFSIIVTFILLYFRNMTLNIMTLGGLALGVGRLVDDSIVVLENIYRHRESGEGPVDAALRGSDQVAMAVLAATITTIVVFLPIAFVSGIAGVLFRPMAYTVSFSLIGSYFVSMMLIPLLTSRFMKVEQHCTAETDCGPVRRLLLRFGGWIDRLDGFYQGIVSWAVRHKRRVMLGTLGVLVVTLLLVQPFRLVDTEFIPASDEGEFELGVSMPVGTSFMETGRVMQRIEGTIKTVVPEAVSVYTIYGEGEGMRKTMDNTGPNYGSIRVKLPPRSQRRRSVDQIIDQLRRPLAAIPDAKVLYTSGGLLSMMLTFGAAGAVSIDIQGYDIETGRKLAEQVKAVVATVNGTRDIEVSRKEGMPELQVVIDRDKAGALGLSVYQIAGAVETAFKGRTATRFRDSRFGKEYDVVVRLREADRSKLPDLRNLTVISPTGQPVALGNLARIEKAFGPVDIGRKNQQRIITVSASATGRAIGSINAELADKLRKLTIPEGFTVEVGGSAKDMAESFRNLLFAMLLAVALVYMVLAAQFESLLDPFVILFSVPLGIIGVIWGLFLTGVNFSVIAFIGVIMLVGIVVSNAILLVDYTNVLRKQGRELYQAVVEAGRTRLRPILMTTLTTIMGMVPMALGIGESAETYAPLAISVISGLAVSTVLTLVFVPTLYIVFEERLKREIRTEHPYRRRGDPHPKRRKEDIGDQVEGRS